MTILDLLQKEGLIEGSLTIIQARLLDCLKTGPMDRRQLVVTLKTPRTTVYDNLLKLQKRKLIEKRTKHNGKRGRPFVIWRLKSTEMGAMKLNVLII